MKKTEGEQNLFASIVNNSGYAIISKTLDGIITSWNHTAAKTFGYSSEEITGKHISILIPPHLQEEEREITKKIKNGEYVSNYKTERKRKDGKLITVSLSISPIKDSLGNITGISKISRDITHQVKTEERLVATENRFRNTLDNMLEGIQIHDFNWKYTYVNDALLKYSRYTREELLGHTLMEKYPGIEHTALFKVMQRCMQERITEHLETEFIFPDGTKGDFQLSMQPVPEGIFILSIDITKRKSAEAEILKLNEELERKVAERTAELESNVQELKESEEKFQKAFQASAAGVTITRLSDSVYLDVNNTFTQLTGYKREELLGRTSLDVGLVIQIGKREKILEQIKKNGSARNFELTIRHRSGRIMEILSSVETVMLKGVKCAINVVYDITERKKMEQAIQDSNNQLEEANKDLESFSYSVSHDLRAPIRAINTYSKILEEDHGERMDEDGKKILASIANNSKKMGHLIDDLLAFSKLGRKGLTVSEINMNALVNFAKSDLLFPEDENRLEFIINDLPPALGDQALVKQVWINLLSNAIKYSRKKPEIKIEIGAYEKDNFVVYFVKDNGAGFSMEYYNKLFGVFSRLHSEEEFEGTGVGLAIVEKIVHRHKGSVWAESEPDKGACFYFSLPAINT